MTRYLSRLFFFLLLVGGMIVMARSAAPIPAQAQSSRPRIIGEVQDREAIPVDSVLVELQSPTQAGPIAQARTQANGDFILTVPQNIPDQLTLHFIALHYKKVTIPLYPSQVQQLRAGETVILQNISMARQVGLAFWVATAIFVMMLVLISTGILHNTLAALFSAALLFAVSYLGQPFDQNIYIFGFERAVSYIDWNVIFLIMGMMIVIAVVERTGLFQWLAFFAFRLSGGRVWLLLTVLMVIAGVVSAFLDNVTTMLLMTPITIQMSLALELNPLALLLPEVFASNVVGISTLIGTPTNILIGSFANITFNQFLADQTPGVVAAMVGLVAYSLYIFRNELRTVKEVSPVLLQTLQSRAKITQPTNLKKAGVIGAGMIVLFVIGSSLHMMPAVTALFGATALMIWIRPNVDEMIDAVDWTTLVFFMSLFIVVGGVQEVGLISLAAEAIGKLVGQNLILAMLVITWFSAILSTAVANIPFTAAMLPIVGYLTTTIPGAGDKVLFFCLSVGAAMGGNGSLIGASANMVTAGISKQAGYPISFMKFLKVGYPALIITVALGFGWLLLRFR